MVSRGFSQAAAVLMLAIGGTAFVPAKLGNVANVRSMTSPVEQLESCDAVLKRNPGKVRAAWNAKDGPYCSCRFFLLGAVN